MMMLSPQPLWAHDIDVAGRVKRVVGAVLGQVEMYGHLTLAFVEVHADDLLCPGKTWALDHVEADAAQAKDHGGATDLDRGGVDDGTYAGCDACAFVAKYRGKGVFGVGARAGELVRGAETRGLDLDQQLAAAGAVKIFRHDFRGLADFQCDDGAGPHHGLRSRWSVVHVRPDERGLSNGRG